PTAPELRFPHPFRNSVNPRHSGRPAAPHGAAPTHSYAASRSRTARLPGHHVLRPRGFRRTRRVLVGPLHPRPDGEGARAQTPGAGDPLLPAAVRADVEERRAEADLLPPALPRLLV